jgi:hypothetical protein
MAKKKPEALTADEAVEVRTLEAKVQAEEAAEKTVNERVAEVFSAPEPVGAAPAYPITPETVAAARASMAASLEADIAAVLASPTSAEFSALDEDAGAWLIEANAAREVYIAGNAISPDELKRLLGQAIGLVTRYRA